MRDDADTKQDDKKPPESLTRLLMDARTILLCGPIETKLTERVISKLVALNEKSREEPIRMYVNSPGGLADDGFAIYDWMHLVQAPVYTICAGLAASAGTIVMIGGEDGHRYMTPNSRMMLHQPSSGARGTASDIKITAEEIIRMRKAANKLFAAKTGHDLEKIEADMARDYWMNAEKALEYKIVDKIITSESEIH